MPIYLDNAATSFPKPESVYVAIDKANRESAFSAGRGSFQRASDLNRQIERTRDAISKLISAPDSRQISFAFSCTDAISTAVLGFLKPGDHVIASAADHNSVLRPLWQLQAERGGEVSIVNCDSNGLVDPLDIESAIMPSTKLVCMTHASNVTGIVQPVKEIGSLCKSKDIAFLLDAAQTIGHIPIDVNDLHCDFLAAPGHKGLLGPLGTGFLFASKQASDVCSPLRFGGTGSTGNEKEQPSSSPQKFEAGNLNVPGIAGLFAGLQWLETDEAKEFDAQLLQLSQSLSTRLSQIEGVTVYGSQPTQTPAISFNIEGVDCQTVGMLLDSQFEIECRTGLHCAPLIHEKIGSASFGGTVRFSPGVFTTETEIDLAVGAVEQIVREMGVTT